MRTILLLLFPCFLSAQVAMNLPALKPYLVHNPHSIQDKPSQRSIFKFEYKWTKTKSLAAGTLLFASMVDGFLEGYGFDGRKYFERHHGANPYGFWGSESWRLAYVNGDPAQGKKNWWVDKMGAPDFYHLADDTRKFSYITAGIVIGIGALHKDRDGKLVWQNWQSFLIDGLIYTTLSSIGKNLAMQYARRK